MSFILGSDATVQALQSAAFHITLFASPDAVTSAKAAQVLASLVKITALGQTASDALATAVAASIARVSVATRRGADIPEMNAACRALAPFRGPNSTPLAAILDSLDGPAMAALNTALATRAT